MSNRAIFAIMTAFALAAIGGLWFLLKSGDEPATAKPSSGAGSAATGFAGSNHGPAQTPEAPKLTPSGQPIPDDLPPKVKEYAANGAVIRDHRSGTHETFDDNGSGAPATGGRRIDVAITKAVSDKVRDAVKECAAAAPQGALTDGKLEGVLNIAIKDKRVAVNQASLNVRGVSGDAAEAVRACVVAKAAGITQAAENEADLPSYDITLSLAL